MTHEQLPLREAIIKQLGRFPDNIPLEPVFGPTTEYPDYTRTLVTYAVEPHERVDAWLLRPRQQPSSGGWPGILAIHQHAGQFYLGKSEPAGLSADAMYHYGLDLCRRGYVVLCPDQLCFEDRRPPEQQRRANSSLSDQGYERFEFTRRILSGA